MQPCLAVAVTAVLATGVAAVHGHHLGQVMVAVLPLAAFGHLRDRPGVPIAVARSLAVRASAERLFALERRPGPRPRPGRPVSPGGGRARGGFRRRRPALRPRPPPGPRRGEPAPAVRRPGRRDRLERCGQVEPRHRAVALLAARGAARCHSAAPMWSGCCRRTRGAACALADQHAQMFAGHGAVEPHPGPARRQRAGDQRGARAARLEAWVAALPAGSTRQSVRTASRCRGASGGASRWPAPCWPPARPRARRAHQRSRRPRWPTSSWTACSLPPGSGASW